MKKDSISSSNELLFVYAIDFIGVAFGIWSALWCVDYFFCWIIFQSRQEFWQGRFPISPYLRTLFFQRKVCIFG